MNFLMSFRYLVALSGSTMKDIADALGYESSYISKWHSGKNLPAARTFQETMDRLGVFFAKRLDTEQGRNDLVRRYPHLARLIQSAGLEKVLPSLLKDAYLLSVEEDTIRHRYEGAKVRPALQAMGIESILQICKSEIYHGIAIAKEDANIYFLADFLRLVNEEFLQDMQFYVTKQERFTLKLPFFHKEDQAKSLADLETYLLLLGRLPFFDVELYDAAGITDDQFFVMENQFSGYCFARESGVPNVLFLSRQPESIEEAVQRAHRAFTPDKTLFRAHPETENLYIQINASFASSFSPIVYIPYCLAYFGDEQLCQELYDEGKLDDANYEIWKNTQSLVSSPGFKGIRLLLRQSVLLQSIRNRQLDLFDRKISVSDEQIRRYLTHPIGPLKKNRNGSVSLIQDHLMEGADRLPELILWAGEKESFALRPQLVYESSKDRTYYPTGSERISQLLYTYLSRLQCHDHTRHGTQAEVADFLQSLLSL